MSTQKQQGVPAVGLLVAAFIDESAGDQTLAAMKEAKKQQKFYYEDAAVIRQDAKGKVHYSETGDMSTGKGAGIGALVGGILGILAGPAVSRSAQVQAQPSAAPWRMVIKASEMKVWGQSAPP